MRGYSSLHPVVVFIHFTAVMVFVMFINNPVILIASLIGACLWRFMNDRRQCIKNMSFDLFVFIILAAANPLFNHKGNTVLFFMNGKAITLEAAVYGIFTAIMMIAVLHWCRIFTKIMTSEKLLFLFGKISSNLSLVLSMALRYIPMLRRQAIKANNTQTAMGFYSKDDYIDKIKGRMRVFSILVTWSMENAIDTANSMRARGYGKGKRTQFSVFRMTKEDYLVLLGTIVFSAIVIIGYTTGEVQFNYYPKLSLVSASAAANMVYIAYGLLVMLPSGLEAKEKLKWTYYRSKI